MTRTVPLFPLGLVAFPHVSVPLHVFEARYRALVRDLLAVEDPDQRVFGIVAIREGYEVGGHGSRSLYRTGCLMALTETEAYDDGRFDIVAEGRDRIRVTDVVPGEDYLVAQVDVLPRDTQVTPASARAAAQALARFGEYRDRVGDIRGGEVMSGPLPRDPELLSYMLASTCSLTLPERQQLLEAPTAADRLDHLTRLLRQEIRAMSVVPSLPATEVARSGWSPN